MTLDPKVEPHPMLSLSRAVGNIIVCGAKTTSQGIAKTEVSDRAKMRMQRQKAIEEEQHMEDLEALKLTTDQRRMLLSPFTSVKVEFSDLDGLSWSDPAAQRLLEQWYEARITTSIAPPEELDWGVPLHRCPPKPRFQTPPRTRRSLDVDEESFELIEDTIRVSKVNRPPISIVTELAENDVTGSANDCMDIESLNAAVTPSSAISLTPLPTPVPPTTVEQTACPASLLLPVKSLAPAVDSPAPKKIRLTKRIPAGSRSPNSRRVITLPTRIPQPLARDSVVNTGAGMRVVSAGTRNLPRVADCRALRRGPTLLSARTGAGPPLAAEVTKAAVPASPRCC
ncbi:hypothetical protein SCP_1300700 [Sparassis crispa]|uniref:Uncharacterized protein n=1 Tax=Sparassis crispa TaxID=139825 RepID=A0A401H1E8_9APHY|nr:hypothetical protein SCP_1300700 [Sparassis crispa]GBE88255.1 hypothetical protein SCP_1300700 [Sparassis crispa]